MADYRLCNLQNLSGLFNPHHLTLLEETTELNEKNYKIRPIMDKNNIF